MPDELLQVESPDSFQRGAYTASDKALRGKKSLATTDYTTCRCNVILWTNSQPAKIRSILSNIAVKLSLLKPINYTPVAHNDVKASQKTLNEL